MAITRDPLLESVDPPLHPRLAVASYRHGFHPVRYYQESWLLGFAIMPEIASYWNCLPGMIHRNQSLLRWPLTFDSQTAIRSKR